MAINEVTKTLTVPAEYREAFRAAALSEMAHVSRAAAETFGEHAEQQLAGYPLDGPRAVTLGGEEHQAELLYVGQVARLIAEFDQQGSSGPVEIRAGHDAMYHALHELAAKVAGPKIAEALDTLPPERGKSDWWVGIADWAMNEIDRIDGVEVPCQ